MEPKRPKFQSPSMQSLLTGPLALIQLQTPNLVDGPYGSIWHDTPHPTRLWYLWRRKHLFWRKTGRKFEQVAPVWETQVLNCGKFNDSKPTFKTKNIQKGRFLNLEKNILILGYNYVRSPNLCANVCAISCKYQIGRRIISRPKIPAGVCQHPWLLATNPMAFCFPIP